MNGQWTQWQPSPQQPWDLARISHLHRRAGFMPNWSTMQRGLLEGFEKTIDRVLKSKPDQTDHNAFEHLSSTIGEAASTSGNPDRLRAWWVFRMLMSPCPLVERMTLLWHNHFATSNDKVQDVSAMSEQNHLLRKHALGHFGDLLRAVVKHRAMLNWLDASSNRKEHPNENLARELMELFTLGEGHYTESDVKEAARCLTGWTIRGNRFAFVEELHDTGEKSVLGSKGNWNGDDLIVLLLEQDATSQRIAWRLCDTFFGEGIVDDDARSELAKGLKQNELNIAWAVETILRSQVFFSDANIRSRVKGPVEYVVGIIRALEIERDPPSTLLIATELRQLGQDLFHPPNVFGWTEGRAWIHTRSLLARHRFVSQLLTGKHYPVGHPAIDLLALAKRHGFGESTEQAIEFLNRLILDRPEPDETLRSSQETDDLRNVAIHMLAAPTNQLS
jgi:uncharacterized protein (DUF1800 family)